MFKNVNYTALAAVALLVSMPFLLDSIAQEGKAPATPAPTAAAPPLSGDLDDPGFDRYVDLILLGRAWDQLDPVLLTDCAMQLAEGERILMRSHKAVSSKQLLELAAKVAAEKRDTATLDRLANVCNATKNTAALEQVTAARKLASASRAIDPAMSVSATETTPDQLAIYQATINGVKGAGMLGDVHYFDGLEEGLNDKQSVLTNLSEAQRNHLKKIMGVARSSMPKESDSSLSDTLNKLKDTSRQHGHGIGAILHGIGHATGAYGHGGGHYGGHGGGHYGGGHYGGGHYGGGHYGGGHYGGGHYGGGHYGGGHHGGGHHGWHP